MATFRVSAYQITNVDNVFDDATAEILEGTLVDGGAQVITVPEVVNPLQRVVITQDDVPVLIRILDTVAAEAALPADERFGFTRKYRNDPAGDGEPQTLVYNETSNTVELRGVTPADADNGLVPMDVTTALHWRDYLIATQPEPADPPV